MLVVSVDSLPFVGGVSIMAHNLCVHLSRENIQVFFLAPKGVYIPSDYNRNYYLIEDVNSSKKDRAGIKGAKEDDRIYCLLQKIYNNYKFDAILLVHPFYYGVACVKFGMDSKIPVTTYFHGLEFKSQNIETIIEAQEKWLPLPKTLPEKTFFTAKNSSLVFTNSSYTRNLITSVDSDIDIVVTGCGVPDELINKSLGRIVDLSIEDRLAYYKHNFNKKDIDILFVGRLVPNKNVDKLIYISKFVDNLKLHVIGDGPEFDNLQNLIRDNSLSDRVFLHGFVDEISKESFLARAKMCALLSGVDSKTGAVEGFGISLVEGISLGAVPVTSGTGGMADIVSSSDYGVIINLECDYVSEGAKLRSIAANFDAYIRIITNAQNQLITKYTWSSISKLIINSIEVKCE